MNRQQRAHWIDQKLNSLYPQTDVPLDHQDPYTLLVAVVLSAQCTDKMVNRVTPNLWKLAKTPKAMAKVPVEKIQEVIRPCGLSPRKSKAIQELSAILVEKHQSQVPTSLEALESLPGVGHKTASVVLVQAGRHTHPPPGAAMEVDQWPESRTYGAGFEKALSA
jgi:endonuclease-3